jgi:hypothetical protein
MLMNLPKISGLLLSLSGNKAKIEVAASCGKAELIELLRWLPWKHQLSFFDHFYPSNSEPGAYVFVQRNEGLCIYMLGNHGWSSEWRKQSPEFLAAYIFLNSEKHRQDSGSNYELGLEEVFRTPWEQ